MEKINSTQQIFLSGISIDAFIEKVKATLSVSTSNDRASPPANPDEFLNRQDVCKILKISLPTLRQWTVHKILPSIKIGRRVLYKLSDVHAAMEKVANQQRLNFSKF